MKNPQISAFFANYSELDNDKYILIDYSFESLNKPEEAAADLCQEMSTSPWQEKGYLNNFRNNYVAKVLNIESKIINHPSSLSIAESMGWNADKLYSCQVRIAFPTHNIGPRIPNLLTALCGEGVFHAPNICAIRLEDIFFPEEYLSAFQGPQYGVEGLRNLLGVYDRPIFMGVIKPSIGLSNQRYAQLAYEAWLGGLDIAIDDELIADSSWSSLEDRCTVLGPFREKAEIETGRKKIFQANITDEVEKLLTNHDLAVRLGANAVMINSMTVGLSACRMLRSHAQVPMVSHFDLYGTMTQIPFQGIRERVFIKLQRMVGFDAILFAGLDNRMKSTPEDVLANVDACLSKMGGIKPSLPIPAGSQWAGSLLPLYKALKTMDFAVIPGRGVFEHPLGPRGGAVSLHQGWEAVLKGISIEDFAKNNKELQLAIGSR